MYPYDPTMLLLIPAMILAFYAQHKVSSTFKKYSRTASAYGMTGADVARRLLSASGVNDVRVEHIRGQLTDHYDPRDKVIRLSDAVYGSTSVAALGVAAHETGHALQHDHGYVPLALRSSITPVANFGSKLSMPLIILGLLLSSFSGEIGVIMIYVGIIMFAAVVAFQIVTLPVEFNASSRALEMLEENRFLSQDELVPAKKVLSAAALTYVAAVAVSLANLLRYLMLANSRNRR